MAGKEAPSEQPPSLFTIDWNEQGHRLYPLRPKPDPATVRSMEQPAWPHPMRSTDDDAAQAVADALAWYGSWLWE